MGFLFLVTFIVDPPLMEYALKHIRYFSLGFLQGFFIDLGFNGAMLHVFFDAFIDQLWKLCLHPLLPTCIVGFGYGIRIVDLILNMTYMVGLVLSRGFKLHPVRDHHCAAACCIRHQNTSNKLFVSRQRAFLRTSGSFRNRCTSLRNRKEASKPRRSPSRMNCIFSFVSQRKTIVLILKTPFSIVYAGACARRTLPAGRHLRRLRVGLRQRRKPRKHVVNAACCFVRKSVSFCPDNNNYIFFGAF